MKDKNHSKLPNLIIIIILLTMGLFVSYTQVNNSCSHYGDKIIAQEKKIILINNRLIRNKEVWSSITSPRNLKKIIEHHNLNMTLPENSQIVRIERKSSYEMTAGLNINK